MVSKMKMMMKIHQKKVDFVGGEDFIKEKMNI